MEFQSLSEILKHALYGGLLPGSEGSPACARGDSQHWQSVVSLQTIGLDTMFIYSKGKRCAHLNVALVRKGVEAGGAHLPWGWQPLSADWISGCWAALHQTHLQTHQALAGSGVHPNEDMHQEEIALCSTGLGFRYQDQVHPTSHWQGLTMVITSCTNLLVPRWGVWTSYEQPGYHYQLPLVPPPTAASRTSTSPPSKTPSEGGWDYQPGWMEFFYFQKHCQQHVHVIWLLHQQHKENVASVLHHFPLVSFPCYFVLFPHCSHLNNFQSHTEVKSS